MINPNPAPARPVRMLLVDHDAGVRFAMGDYFRRIGVTVDEAADGDEASAWLALFRHDAMVTDLRLLPRFRDEGLELAKRVRMISPTTALCILTLPAAPSLMQEAEEVADAVLTRPLQLPDLAQVVLALLHHPRAPRFTSRGTTS